MTDTARAVPASPADGLREAIAGTPYGPANRLHGWEAAERSATLLRLAAVEAEHGDVHRALAMRQIAEEYRELADCIAANPHLLVRPDPNRRDDDDRRR